MTTMSSHSILRFHCNSYLFSKRSNSIPMAVLAVACSALVVHSKFSSTNVSVLHISIYFEQFQTLSDTFHPTKNIFLSFQCSSMYYPFNIYHFMKLFAIFRGEASLPVLHVNVSGWSLAFTFLQSGLERWQYRPFHSLDAQMYANYFDRKPPSQQHPGHFDTYCRPFNSASDILCALKHHVSHYSLWELSTF